MVYGSLETRWKGGNCAVVVVVSKRKKGGFDALERPTFYVAMYTLTLEYRAEISTRVSYYSLVLTVTVDCQSGTPGIVSQLFALNKAAEISKSLLRLSVLQESIQMCREKNTCCCCCKTGPVTCALRLDRTGYVPGEDINLDRRDTEP